MTLGVWKDVQEAFTEKGKQTQKKNMWMLGSLSVGPNADAIAHPAQLEAQLKLQLTKVDPGSFGITALKECPFLTFMAAFHNNVLMQIWLFHWAQIQTLKSNLPLLVFQSQAQVSR